MSPRRFLVGGVGYRWQRDASFGVVAADALAREDWLAPSEVMDLGYGALYAAQDLGAFDPPLEHLVLLAGVERGRPPGTLEHARWTPPPLDPEDVQSRVREAGAGVLHVDHLLIIAAHFGTLPPRVDVFELEPVDASPGEALSPTGAQRLTEVIAGVRALAEVAERSAAPCAP